MDDPFQVRNLGSNTGHSVSVRSGRGSSGWRGARNGKVVGPYEMKGQPCLPRHSRAKIPRNFKYRAVCCFWHSSHLAKPCVRGLEQATHGWICSPHMGLLGADGARVDEHDTTFARAVFPILKFRTQSLLFRFQIVPRTFIKISLKKHLTSFYN